MVRNALIASILAYATSRERIRTVLKQLNEHHDFLSVLHSPDDAIQAFVMAVTPTEAYVAFRGSSNLRDWMTNVRFATVSTTFGALHSGFRGRAELIPLKNVLEMAGGRKLVFCGHSLGGACATICAMRYIESCHGVELSNMSCVAFGAPFVGTATAQQFLATDRKGIRLSRHFLTVVNQRDCVPGILNIAASLSAAETKVTGYAEKFADIVSILSPAFSLAAIFGASAGVAAACAAAGEAATKLAGGVNSFAAALRSGDNKWKETAGAVLPDYEPLGQYQFLQFRSDVADAAETLHLGKQLGTQDYHGIKQHLGKHVDMSHKSVIHHSLWQYMLNYSALCPPTAAERKHNLQKRPAIVAGTFTEAAALQETLSEVRVRVRGRVFLRVNTNFCSRARPCVWVCVHVRASACPWPLLTVVSAFLSRCGALTTT
jgi:hypothetical protein